MKLFNILEHAQQPPADLPDFVSDMRDIDGVRVVRLRGSVGKDIGAEAAAADQASARRGDVFTRPVLFDFKDVTESDSATLAYLVLALRRRMAAHASVGIINPSAQLLAELEIAKLGDLFRVFPSEKQALADLSPKPPKRGDR